MDRNHYLARVGETRALFKHIFQRDIAERYLPWRYTEAPVGEVAVELAERDGAIVGHYASSAAAFQLGGETLLGALVGAVMTHESLRGQGVFQKMAVAHEEQLRRAGYDFAFAFPNRNSEPIFFRHLGWVPIFDITNRTVDVSNWKRRSDDDFAFDDTFERFDYDALTDRSGLFACRRDRAWFHWRYAENPINQYRNLVLADGETLRGYAIVKFYTPGADTYLDLVDYFAFDDEDFLPLLERVLDFASASGCRAIGTWASRHHVSHLAFCRLGFAPSMPVTYLSFKALRPGLHERVESFSRWWITMGDSDVY